ADGKGVSRLRLWAADSKDFNMQLFNDGEYLRAVEQKAMAESITKVLYPGDNHTEGKSLRLNQQYFLVSATVQDIIKRHLRVYKTLDNLPDKVAIHLNDTHPVLAVPELMRILLDECGYRWDDAWNIVNRTIAYTNHTVMKEALECWSEEMFKTKLPRIYQIVCEINRRYCYDLANRFSYTDIDSRKIEMVYDTAELPSRFALGSGDIIAITCFSDRDKLLSNVEVLDFEDYELPF
ncbi:MAG: glycogen/starch/alpha-glucan phosphorylase, partial [Oscillospiraceae bacterium]|nr:glycogen/starch/alpha-glucan phosphorylase [Oscillospiraceae bacterium]